MKTWSDYKTEIQEINRDGLEKVASTPPPEGQKYATGTRVRIADDLGDRMSHFPSGANATVLHTHAHAYGGDHVKSYCLDIDGKGQHAWYYEHQLTPLDSQLSMDQLIEKVLAWGVEKGITGPEGKATSRTQSEKMREEARETWLAVYDDDMDEIKDGIGDTCVTLILLAERCGMTLEECLQAAYDVISKRTGKMVDGTFVKDKEESV